jgi:hypothetical protein
MDTAPTPSSTNEGTQPAHRAAGGPLFRWWVWLSGGLIALVLLSIVWGNILYAPMPAPAQRALPLFTVYPAPTLTDIPPTPSWTPEISPIPGVPTVLPGTIAAGMMVEVNGTGGDGLNLRDAPNTNGKVLFRVFEHELFRVVDGPQQSNGYTWWLLQGVIDSNRQGWGVENYLKPSA